MGGILTPARGVEGNDAKMYVFCANLQVLVIWGSETHRFTSLSSAHSRAGGNPSANNDKHQFPGLIRKADISEGIHGGTIRGVEYLFKSAKPLTIMISRGGYAKYRRAEDC